MVKIAYNQTSNYVMLDFCSCNILIISILPPPIPRPYHAPHFCACVRACIATAKHLFFIFVSAIVAMPVDYNLIAANQKIL